MMCHGHESWHPDPEFYYKVGGGPMFDMGPYYLTALVNLLGPVARVTGSARITFPERTITSQPKYGTKIKVDVPTHVAGVMDFANGAVGTIITSFDVWAADAAAHRDLRHRGHRCSVPDPNGFGGPVQHLRGRATRSGREMPLTHGYAENSRGIGVADMAYAPAVRPAAPGQRRTGLPRAGHHARLPRRLRRRASTSTLKSTCERPAPLPLGLRKGTLDG